ncbi:hypothetical protein IFM89_014068 [Coptis chinensis]|uniref:KIB1-4 beta-propeller domain-containing protein n=1 Tax=Coptis chinensis TaxID=261450 RepID=A0A835LVF7_9MAGN|nr:hypothetical protein IFM89_014068 [Coptis chinensis]
MERTKKNMSIMKEHIGESDRFHLNDLPVDTLHKIAMCLPLTVEYFNLRLACATICFSMDGWLLMSKSKDSMFFFNPFARTTTELHDLPEHVQHQGLSFSSAPTSQDCIVFGVCFGGYNMVQILYMHPKEGEWTSILGEHEVDFTPSNNNPIFYDGAFYCHQGLSFSSAPTSQDCIVFGVCFGGYNMVQILYMHPREGEWTSILGEHEVDFTPSNNNPIFYDGAFYCIGIKESIGVFDIKDKKWIVLCTPHHCLSFQLNYLVKSNGEILSIFFGRWGKFVHVY